MTGQATWHTIGAAALQTTPSSDAADSHTQLSAPNNVLFPCFPATAAVLAGAAHWQVH
jgi:hypothetical protein